ncbi:LRP chaperone MESD [Sarcoptes scabiei]|nr:LRP chaperone MESD [Sarcoptes scabiei]
MPKGAQELSFYFTSISLIITFVIIAIVVENVQSQKDWKQKDIRDYNEADMERLYEQWEKDEEPLDDDELPEYLRKSPPIDMSKMDFSNPENVLRTSKKDDRAIFMFKDGSQAWDAKDFLITQDRCKDVTIDNKVYPGINYQAEHQEL